MVLGVIVGALPASAHHECRVDALGRMKGPVIDYFGVHFVGVPLLAVDVESNAREVNLDGIVVPAVVANLAELPAPLSGAEHVRIALHEVTTDEKDESAVTNEQSVVMAIHFCGWENID